MVKAYSYYARLVALLARTVVQAGSGRVGVGPRPPGARPAWTAVVRSRGSRQQARGASTHVRATR